MHPVQDPPVEVRDTPTALMQMLAGLGARRILDIGCGDGAMARVLTDAGLSVTGIDPSAQAVAQARLNAPGAEFHCARAESLPPGLPTFDAACFVNALHHVDADQMAPAILQAVDAVTPGGHVVIIEPLAQGSFSRAMRPVEDETAIRATAARTVEGMIRDHAVALRELRRWNRESRFAGLGDFIAQLSRVSTDRAELARRNHAALARAWRENIHTQDGRAVLVQPMICWVLSAPPAAPA